MLIAFSGESIAGVLVLYANDFDGLVAHIPILSVSPEFRNQGLGAALLSRSLARCRARKMVSLTLEVQKENHAAIRLYEELGFRNRGQEEGRNWMETDVVAPNDPYLFAPTPLECHSRTASRLGLDIDLRIKRDDLYPVLGGGH